MNLGAAQSWARRCRGTGWLDAVDELAGEVRARRSDSGRLLVVGHPDDPPWHFAAHLESLTRDVGSEGLLPMLTDVDSVAHAGRRDTVLSVSEQRLPPALVDRLDHVASKGAAVLGLCQDDPDLQELAAGAVSLDPASMTTADGLLMVDFETASHIFGVRSTTRAAPRRAFGGLRRRSG